MQAYPKLHNIAPHVWGPHAWKFMHAVALTYPEQPSQEEQQAAFQFFSSLQYLLPCEACKLNYVKELKMFPLQDALVSKQKLNEWLTELHNSVNERLKKTIMTTEQVLQYVFEKKDEHSSNTNPQTTSADNTVTATPDNNNNNNNNTWGIAATCIAGGLLVAVVVLVTLHQKQKKVSRK
jgi:hypothetical protein